jgi:hypothetical protein
MGLLPFGCAQGRLAVLLAMMRGWLSVTILQNNMIDLWKFVAIFGSGVRILAEASPVRNSMWGKKGDFSVRSPKD